MQKDLFTLETNMSSVESFIDFVYDISVTQAALGTIFLLLFSYNIFWQYRGVPPGPWGVPLLGFWPFIKPENAIFQLEEIRNKYGEINSFTVTGALYINLCTHKLIKEAHLSKSDCFLDRPSGYSLLTLSFKEAVSFVNGESWKVQRKFYQQKFREYGMLAVKESFSDSVYYTLKETIQEIREMQGKAFVVADLLTVRCSSIIKRILFNDQGITDEELAELNQEYHTVLASMTAKNLLLTGNFAKYVVFPLIPSYRAMLRSHSRIQDILTKVIKRHKDNFDETQIMDIIDSYYKEKKDRERKGDPTAKYFTDKALLSSIYQFVTDGVLTIAFFIGLFLEKLALNPKEQQQIYQELSDVLGSDRQPTMEDRNNLPYTNAFIYEVIRHSDFFPMFPSMQCTKETTIQGYRIPKGAITLINVWCANHDPTTYEEPNVFNPNRFMTRPGKPKAELPMMFGVGKRNCMGEPFALIETFLFLTTIVKNFHLTTEEASTFNFNSAGEVKITAKPRIQVQKVQ